MKSFKEPNRQQQLLFAEVNLNSLVEQDTPAYIIDQLVNKLDTSAIEDKYNLDIWQGKDPLHPKTYLKVCLLALHNCRFSLRKMEYDTQYNLVYRWITGDKAIDHSTLGKFLVNFKTEINALASQVILIAKEEGLLNFDLLAIDTVKIRANASYKNTRDLKAIKKAKKKIAEQLSEFIEQAEEVDKKSQEVLKKRKERLKAAEKKLQERMKENPAEETINLTDFDCKIVQQANGEKNTGYCVTTATDTNSDVITHFEVDNDSNDAKKLLPVIDGSLKNTQQKHKTVIADSGFSSFTNLEKLVENQQDALIPDRRFEAEATGQTTKGDYDRSHFKYFPKHDYYRCPEKNKLIKKGEYKKDGKSYSRYANPVACKSCPMKKYCTSGTHRIIMRDHREHFRSEMRDHISKKKNQKRYKKRSHSAESPFGDIKHNKKFRIFQRRGFEKVKMEVSLIVMLHNMMKIGKKMCLSGT